LQLVERFINTLPPTIGLTALQDGASASAIETQDKRHEQTLMQLEQGTLRSPWEDAKIEPERQPFALADDVDDLRARLQLVERFINGASASAIETQDKRHEQTLMQLEQGTLRSHFRVQAFPSRSTR
jgi:hypothetical protein